MGFAVSMCEVTVVWGLWAGAQQTDVLAWLPYPGLQAHLEWGRFSFVFELLATGMVEGM